MKDPLRLWVKRIKLSSAGHLYRKPTGRLIFTESFQSEAISPGQSIPASQLCILENVTYNIIKYAIKHSRKNYSWYKLA